MHQSPGFLRKVPQVLNPCFKVQLEPLEHTKLHLEACILEPKVPSLGTQDIDACIKVPWNPICIPEDITQEMLGTTLE